MKKLDRRSFIKLMGKGTAILGVGSLSGKAWLSKTAVARAQDIKNPTTKTNWDEWEFYYPGKYDEQDTKILKKFQEKLDLINKREPINIGDLASGRLDGQPGIGDWAGKGIKVTHEEMMTLANTNVGDIPLFTDRNYAKKTKYGDLITFPLILEPDFQPAMLSSEGFADYMVVSDHNDTMNYYKPIYEGDTLYIVIDEQHFKDITPAAGSHYRTFLMIGWGRVFNQKGELVAEGANILKESFRRHKDPSKRNIDGAHAWESPDWWSQHPAHIYTDEDWEKIKNIWKNEKVRGSEILYWDDVKIGDQPTPTVSSPILLEEEADIMGEIPQRVNDTKKNVLDTETFSRMVKNKQGIYVLPEYLEKKPKTPLPDIGGDSIATPEIANRDGRAAFGNAVASKKAAGMLYNWLGDQGWLQRIGWDIMAEPPGYDKSVIPRVTKDMMPALFDKYPYMDKVPYMKGKRADCHGIESDAVISRAYVTDKYKKDGEYFVDLTFWCETVDNYLIEEGFATVKLPKKS